MVEWEVMRDDQRTRDRGDTFGGFQSESRAGNLGEGIIDETRERSTWPIKAPVAVRIVATSLIPLVYFLVQELIRRLWLQ
jgi:hypothetical protein